MNQDTMNTMEPVTQWHVRLANGRQFGPADMCTIVQWALQGRVPEDALLVSLDGEQTRSVLSEPEIVRILRAPPTVPSANIQQRPSIGAPGLIPYSNPKALIGYYLSIGGLIPFLGLPLAIAAVICGLMGFKAWRADHAIKGSVHAWVAIILGGLEIAAYIVLVAFFVVLGP